MKKYNVALLGATGAVGQEMLKVLEEYDIPVAKFLPLASARRLDGSGMYLRKIPMVPKMVMAPIIIIFSLLLFKCVTPLERFLNRITHCLQYCQPACGMYTECSKKNSAVAGGRGSCYNRRNE